MFKWVEIGLQNNKPRYQLLSEFLAANNFANQVEFIQTTEDEFQKKLPEWLTQYDGVRIGRGLGEVVIPMFENHPVMVDKIRAADAIVKMDGKWWLKADAVDGFSRVLANVGERFDRESSVLVVGAGAAARVAITGLFMLGFKNFSISTLDQEKAKILVEKLSRTHLGAAFRVVPKEGLILLPGIHGVLVNTTPMGEDNPMLAELYYFNFFKVGGVAIEFSILPVETPLLVGAKEVGASCVYGYQISAQTDMIWCEQITGRKLLNSESYEQKLGEHLRAQNI